MTPWPFALLLGVCMGAAGWELLRQYLTDTFGDSLNGG